MGVQNPESSFSSSKLEDLSLLDFEGKYLKVWLFVSDTSQVQEMGDRLRHKEDECAALRQQLTKLMDMSTLEGNNRQVSESVWQSVIQLALHSVEQSVCQYVRYDRYKWIQKKYLKNHPEQVKGNESTSVTLQPEVGSEIEGAVGYSRFWVPILELQLLFLILNTSLPSRMQILHSK